MEVLIKKETKKKLCPQGVCYIWRIVMCVVWLVFWIYQLVEYILFFGTAMEKGFNFYDGVLVGVGLTFSILLLLYWAMSCALESRKFYKTQKKWKEKSSQAHFI